MFPMLKRVCESLVNDAVLYNRLLNELRSSNERVATRIGISKRYCTIGHEKEAIQLLSTKDNLFTGSSEIYEEANACVSCLESNERTNDDREYENNIKNKILDASLNYVAEHGWTKAAIVAGAQSVGYPGGVSDMFPLGGSNLVLYYYSICNARLVECLKIKTENKLQDMDKQEYKKMFVYDAVQTRLRMIIPYIEEWPQALATLTLSRAVPTALSNLLTLVDDICYYAGDKSVDFDWYVRRVALAGIYKTTELYMLQDKSPNYEETWKFLKTQLDDAVAVYSCISHSEQATQLTKDICLATFSAARNILGLNRKK